MPRPDIARATLLLLWKSNFPTVSLLRETFNVLDLSLGDSDRRPEQPTGITALQTLFISGNYSSIHSRLDRNFTELEVRREFASFQLLTILKENHHSFLFLEHDPMLYEDACEMVEYVAQALKQTSRDVTIFLYSPALDPHLQKMTELANRVFCIYGEQAKSRKAEAKMPGAQKTLEAYS